MLIQALLNKEAFSPSSRPARGHLYSKAMNDVRGVLIAHKEPRPEPAKRTAVLLFTGMEREPKKCSCPRDNSSSSRDAWDLAGPLFPGAKGPLLNINHVSCYRSPFSAYKRFPFTAEMTRWKGIALKYPKDQSNGAGWGQMTLLTV